MFTLLFILALFLWLAALILFASVFFCPQRHYAWITWGLGGFLFIISALLPIPRILIVIGAVVLLVSFFWLVFATFFRSQNKCRSDKCHNKKKSCKKSKKDCWDSFEYDSYNCCDKSQQSCRSDESSDDCSDSFVSESCDSNKSDSCSYSRDDCSNSCDESEECSRDESCSDKSEDSCSQESSNEDSCKPCQKDKCKKFTKRIEKKFRAITCKQNGKCVYEMQVKNCNTGRWETIAVVEERPKCPPLPPQ